MDINGLVQKMTTMFPNAKVAEAVQQAQQMIQGTENNLESVRATAQRIGIDSGFVDAIYRKYGNTPQAKMICNLLGTSPDAIKDDAMNLVGGSKPSTGEAKPPAAPKFPRLK